MRKYKPATPFNVAMELLIPSTTKTHGQTVKTYPESGEVIYGSFRTFGGTETTQNDVITVLDTAHVETWYRPDITADCRLKICNTGAIYEIVGTPENIYMRNQYLDIRAEKVGGAP